MANPRTRLKFHHVLAVGGLLVALSIAFGPLVREAWARLTWQKTPCYLYPDGSTYLFEYHGKKWYSSRQNMWFIPGRDAALARTDSGFHEMNAACFIDGGDPPISVLHLDAYQHLEGGSGNYASAGLLASACLVMAFIASRKAKPPLSASPG